MCLVGEVGSASMCVCWCLCAFERNSHRGLVQPGCPKNDISSPRGTKQGVQTQGTHQVLRAGTQRAQKHTGHNTQCKSEGVWLSVLVCVSLEVSNRP